MNIYPSFIKVMNIYPSFIKVMKSYEKCFCELFSKKFLLTSIYHLIHKNDQTHK